MCPAEALGVAGRRRVDALADQVEALRIGTGQALGERALGWHVKAGRPDRAQDPARPLQLRERLVVEARDQEGALGRHQRALPGGAEAVGDERVPVPVALAAQVGVEVVRVDRFPDEVLFLERGERATEGQAPLEPRVPLRVARANLEAARRRTRPPRSLRRGGDRPTARRGRARTS